MRTFQQHHNESNMPAARLGDHFFQPKLKIGRPGDKYEQEADCVADAVMRMLDSQVQMQPVEEEEGKLQMTPEEPRIQQMCPRCRERARQSKPLDCPDCAKKLQMSPVIQEQSDGHSYASPEISSQLNASRGQGRPLPDGVQQEMSHKMGADFSSVNIHADSKSQHLNQQLGAKAFTHGSDIYFNKREYNPASDNGKHLLAHELTHVVQQAGSGSQIQKKNKIKDCSETKKEQIKSGVKSAKKMAHKAIDVLKKEELKLMYHERKAMQSNFGSPDQKMKKKIIERYENIISKLNSKIIQCKKECPNEEETKVTCGKGSIPGEKIYICPSFGGICEPGETILHEAGHNEGAHHGEDGAYDNAYAFEKFAVAASVKKKLPDSDLGEKEPVKVPSFDE